MLKENLDYDINYDYNYYDYITMIATMILAVVLNEPKFQVPSKNVMLKKPKTRSQIFATFAIFGPWGILQLM